MNKRDGLLAIVLLLISLIRLYPHPYNLTPVTALALFGSAYFTRRYLAYLVPLVGMLISDSYLGWHSEMPAVYLSLVGVIYLGSSLSKQKSAFRVLGFSLASSLLFFIITNFSVWVTGTLYPKTGVGLVACFIAAIPFFQNTLLGDLLYSVVLFGGMYLFTTKVSWSPNPQRSTY